MSRKILVSRGFGAGWSTWQSVPTKFACEYQPIIEALDRGETLDEDHPAIQQYIQECQTQFDYEPYIGGLDGLCIIEIGDDDGYFVEEYDGAETLRLKSQQDWN